MYSIDLSKIKVKDFVKLLKSIDLLPGRRILLNGLDEITITLAQNGITDLAELQKLLKNKTKYAELSKVYKTTDEYLIVLNREINSYVNKPIKLDDISILSKQTLVKLNKIGIYSTKDFYEACISTPEKHKIIEQTGIPKSDIDQILSLSDLLRINGVGPAYAIILYRIGIRTVTEYLETNSQEILEKFQNENRGNKYTKANLGIKDVDYCKRFCKFLEQEL